MFEENFARIFDEMMGRYLPQYLTGKLSLEEAIDKMIKEIKRSYESEGF